MIETIENAGHYEYKCLDGKTILKFRTMSPAERKRVFFETKSWNWIIHGLSRAEREFDIDLWDRQFRKLAQMVAIIGIEKTAKKFSKMGENIADVLGVCQRIMQVEMALNEGEDVPEQESFIPDEDVVDEAEPPELEKMGESSPAEDHTQTT